MNNLLITVHKYFGNLVHLILLNILLCKKILLDHFDGKKCAKWRNICSSIIGESVST